jgi:hypothetical protein
VATPGQRQAPRTSPTGVGVHRPDFADLGASPQMVGRLRSRHSFCEVGTGRVWAAAGVRGPSGCAQQPTGPTSQILWGLRRPSNFCEDTTTCARSGRSGARLAAAQLLFLWIFTETFIPGTSARLSVFVSWIFTGMTWVTFWKLPEVLDWGNREKTPAAPP